MSEVFNNDPLMDDFDATNITPEDLNSGGGGGVDAPGWAHFIITDVTPFALEGSLPNIRFQCSCRAHVDPKQVDKMLWHRIYRKTWADKAAKVTEDISEDSRKINLRFARGLGLISDADLGKKVAVNWGLAKGRQFCAKIAKVPKKDQGVVIPNEFEYRIDYGRVYPPTHEEAADCPKDAEALAFYKGGASGGGSDLDDV